MSIPNQIAVHPLVLLSVVDHYNRVIGKSKSRNKRVVGALLGLVSSYFLYIFSYTIHFFHIPYIFFHFLYNFLIIFSFCSISPIFSKIQNKIGETNKGKIDITNSYALPFEEDPKEEHIWFLDHIYHEQMYSMFKKVIILGSKQWDKIR